MERRVRLIHDSRTCNVARHVLCDPVDPGTLVRQSVPVLRLRPTNTGWSSPPPSSVWEVGRRCANATRTSTAKRAVRPVVFDGVIHSRLLSTFRNPVRDLMWKTSSHRVSWSASHASWASSIEFVAAHRTSGPTLRGDLNPADQSTISLFLDPSPKQVHPVRECDSGDGNDARNTWEPKKLAEESANVLWPGDPDLAGRRGGREGGSGKVHGHVPDNIEFGLFVTSVNCNGKFELQVGSVRCKLHCVREASPKPIPSFDMKGHIEWLRMRLSWHGKNHEHLKTEAGKTNFSLLRAVATFNWCSATASPSPLCNQQCLTVSTRERERCLANSNTMRSKCRRCDVVTKKPSTLCPTVSTNSATADARDSRESRDSRLLL